MREPASVLLGSLLAFTVAVAMIRAVVPFSAPYPSETVFSDPSLSVPADAAHDSQRRAGELVTEWLAESYPERIQRRELRDEGWALRLADRWFYWADGRLLPEEKLEHVDEYSGIRFYDYRLGEHELPEFDEELVALLREHYGNGGGSGDRVSSGRHPAFYEALYGFENRLAADRGMQRMTFLNVPVRVHPMVVHPLSEVEAEIRSRMESDPEVASFVRDIVSVSGFYWRDILGSASRSYHAYGTAVDLLPRRYVGGFGYWRWAAQAGIEEWWSLPLSRRHSVPQPVIDAFERHGFVWGGKWIGFDPIHFEYRPEV
ncbi:MAG: M15 family metallopeptidase, partial [Spirochaetota bacterium]